MPRYAVTFWPKSPVRVEVDAADEDDAIAEMHAQLELIELFAGGSVEVLELEPEPRPAEVAP